MNEKYEPTPEEMSKAEEMVLPSQKESDIYRAKLSEVARKLGIEKLPPDFESGFREDKDAAPNTLGEKIALFIKGTFDGEMLVLERLEREVPAERRSKPSLANGPGTSEYVYSGSFGGLPLTNEEAASLSRKLGELWIASNTALGFSEEANRNMRKEVEQEREQVFNQEQTRIREDKIGKLKKLFGI